MDSYQKFVCEKAKKKRDLLGKMFFPRTPIVLLDYTDKEMAATFDDLLDGLANLDMTVIVLAPKDTINGFPQIKNVHFFDNQSETSAYAAADFAVSFNGNVSSVWKHGCVPIAKIDGDATNNYNPLAEEGNGFYFKNSTKWEVFAAIVRALETYQFPYDWENLIREILKKAD